MAIPTRSMRGALSGRVALVTGGGTGIGAAVALGLSRKGARVVVAGRRPAPLAKSVRRIERSGGEARPVACDVSTEEGAAAAVGACIRMGGRLDVVVSSAGTFQEGSVEELSLPEWRAALHANLDSVFLVARAAIPHLRRSGGGVIVNISSTLGSRGLARAAAYCAAKGAVENLTRAMALDHAQDRIRVVAVAPGIVATDMGLRGERRGSKTLQAELANLHPWGRLGRPEDVAALVVQLCRPESDWITGSIHVVDGGLTAKG